MQGNDHEFIDISDDTISYFIRCEHLARYIYASEQIRKRKKNTCLDAACGSGYGSFELAKYAESVISIDKYKPFEKYNNPNTTFFQYDLNSIDFINHIGTDKKYDAVVCFETLEHLNNPKKFLTTITGIMKNKGLLFVSVPNGDFEKTDETGIPINTYHLHKFDEPSFAKMLTECGFEIVRTLYQPTSAQLYRNEAKAARDLKLNTEFLKQMSPKTEDIHYYSRVYAWPDENKGQSYSIIFMCEKKY